MKEFLLTYGVKHVTYGEPVQCRLKFENIQKARNHALRCAVKAYADFYGTSLKAPKKMDKKLWKSIVYHVEEIAQHDMWHLLPTEEAEKWLADKKTKLTIIENFRRPAWCTDKEALSGCFSLLNIKDGLRTRVSETYCSSCPSFLKPIL